MNNVVDDLQMLIRTRHNLVRIETLDEEHAVEVISRAAERMNMPVYTWSVTEGLRSLDRQGRPQNLDGANTLLESLHYICKADTLQAVYVFKGALRLLADKPVESRLLHDAVRGFDLCASTLFLVDAEGKLPLELSVLSVPYELKLPDTDEIRRMVAETARQFQQLHELKISLTPDDLSRFIESLRGLTRLEVRQLLNCCMLDDGVLNADDLQNVLARKRQRVGESGVLDFVPVEEGLRIGGMKSLRRWLKLRSSALTPEARLYGLDAPKGILMLGVQGCGKSLMARATAAEWKMPLLRLDVGTLYDKFIGETERHLRHSLEVAAAMSPCVLWIDEIEKAFASVGNAETDGGLSRRMFGSLLTWLQEHKDPIFTVATANDVEALPPELMRKGRFDEIFFVDLPDEKTRAQIFAIQLNRRNRDYKTFDCQAMAAVAEGFSGAEIEQAVVAAMYTAFGEKREVTTEDIVAEVRETRPLTVTAAEKVNQLRVWANGRCVPAD